jgi:Abortive infection C-terminus
MSAPELSRKPLLTLIDFMSGVTLTEINKLFVGNGLEVERDDYVPSQWNARSGERRAKAAGYVSAIDMTDEVQRVRLLRVIDDILAIDWWNDAAVAAFVRELRRDGVRVEMDTIDPTQLKLPDRSRGRLDTALPDFASITDLRVLREHAERMQRASLNADAPDAILAARELVESVCKLICEDFSVAVPKNPNAGQLYKLAAKALGLDAADVPDSDPAAAASRKVLSGLVRVVDGLGDLRTRVGRGHGRTQTGLARQRHAELAVGAAGTLAVFLLDTWQDRKAKEAPQS